MSMINQELRWVPIPSEEEGGVPMMQLQYTSYNVIKGSYEWKNVELVNDPIEGEEG